MLAAHPASRFRSAFCGLSIAALAFGCTARTPTQPGRHVRFVLDTTITSAGLPGFGDAWSPDGRSFALRRGIGIVLYRTDTLSISREFDLSDPVRACDWAPDGSTVACLTRRRDPSNVGSDVHVVGFSRAPSLASSASNAFRLFWLANGTLLTWSGRGGELWSLGRFVLEPLTDPRALRRHTLFTGGGSKERELVVLEVGSAPDSAMSIAAAPGYSFVERPAGDRTLLLEWNVASRRYLALRARPGVDAVILDSLGQETGRFTERDQDLFIRSLACDGDLALGTPLGSDEGGLYPTALFAVSLSEHWRTEVSGLPRGCFGAVASPVGNRVLIESPDGLLLGRLEVSR
ncbi:MAG: hypothetical protein IT348_07670 [Candidatus Eisenbacteria bacterium]|nr:hypothetical protein [Candidatus Eisenbacteria bacterium]